MREVMSMWRILAMSTARCRKAFAAHSLWLTSRQILACAKLATWCGRASVGCRDHLGFGLLDEH